MALLFIDYETRVVFLFKKRVNQYFMNVYLSTQTRVF